MADSGDFLVDGPERFPRVVLAPGAGAPMDSPFMERVARGLAARGARVVRFEFPYMAAWRRGGRRGPPDAQPVLRRHWLEVIERLGGGRDLVIGGKSLGGRMASLVADEAGARGLLCLGYPFHPPGRPERLRTAHLADLATPTLIVQGTRDTLGGREDVVGYRLSTAIRVEWIEDGDHSFEPTRRSCLTLDESLERAIDLASTFVESLGDAPAPPGPSRHGNTLSG